MLTWQSVPPTWAPLKFHSIIIIILWTERMLSRAEQCCAGQLSKPISIHFILITVAPPASGARRHQHCDGSGGRENMLQETDLQKQNCNRRCGWLWTAGKYTIYQYKAHLHYRPQQLQSHNRNWKIECFISPTWTTSHQPAANCSAVEFSSFDIDNV